MRWVAERMVPERFFKYYIVKVCDEAQVDIKEKFLQIEYLSKMLTAFVEPEKYFKDSGDLVRVIDVLKEEVEKPEVLKCKVAAVISASGLFLPKIHLNNF